MPDKDKPRVQRIVTVRVGDVMRDGGRHGGRWEECELEGEFDGREASCFVIDVRGSSDDF